MTPINFVTDSDEYHENFPKSISPQDILPISATTVAECFRMAQEAHIPYLCLVVVESGRESETFYQVYESSCYSTFTASPNFNKKDPITARLIRKVHYFAFPCFQFDRHTICKPVDLKNDDNSFTLLKIEPLNKGLKTLILDGLNPYLLSCGTSKEKQKYRKIQYAIADCIYDQSIFKEIDPYRRIIETVKWLWGSSQGSYEGKMRLADKIRENPEIVDDHEKRIIEILSTPIPSSNHPEWDKDPEENSAAQEVIDLLNSLAETGAS